MKRLIEQLWTSAPADICERVRQRAKRLLNRSAWDWDYSLNWVLKSSKHINPKGHIEVWERYWRVLGTNGCEGFRGEFSFQDQSVLELGCGPLLGFGPIALFNGAKEFHYHEPGLLRDVVESKQIKMRYFVPMHEELVANYGDRMSFDCWYERVVRDTVPVNFNKAGSVSLVLSTSVLEHIKKSELKQLLQQLWQLSAPGSWFLHGVDFGPHGFSGGLQRLYETIDRRTPNPGLINLLRLSEIEKELGLANCEIVKSAVYKLDKIDRRNLHESWNSYSSSDLNTRVAFIIGKCKENKMGQSPTPADLGAPPSSK
jgi:hypothetical protein